MGCSKSKTQRFKGAFEACSAGRLGSLFLCSGAVCGNLRSLIIGIHPILRTRHDRPKRSFAVPAGLQLLELSSLRSHLARHLRALGAPHKGPPKSNGPEFPEPLSGLLAWLLSFASRRGISGLDLLPVAGCGEPIRTAANGLDRAAHRQGSRFWLQLQTFETEWMNWCRSTFSGSLCWAFGFVCETRGQGQGRSEHSPTSIQDCWIIYSKNMVSAAIADRFRLQALAFAGVY